MHFSRARVAAHRASRATATPTSARTHAAMSSTYASLASRVSRASPARSSTSRASSSRNRPRRAATLARASRDAVDAREATTVTGRRAMLALASAFVATTASREALAANSADRAFREVCDPTADGADCRAKILAADAAGVESYENTKSGGKFKPASASTNPNLTTYQSDTLTFVDEVETLLAMDVYDPTREKAIAVFQKKSNDWSGKYAPGGSSKMASGRAFYNALNQLAGHYSFNGLAPVPKSRLDVVETNIAKTRELIAEGR